VSAFEQAKLERLAEVYLDGPGHRSCWVGWTGSTEPLVTAEPDTPMPAASTVKTVLALAAARYLDWRAPVPLVALARTMYPSIMVAFSPDDTLTISELVAFSLLTSDNPCADYLFGQLGERRLRDEVTSLHLAQTAIPVGYADAMLGEAGRANTTSPRDLASILRHVEAARGGDERVRLIWSWLVNNQRNNRLPALLPDEVPVAHKTGSLVGVVNDAGVICPPGGSPLTVVTLIDGADDPLHAAESIARFGEGVHELIQGT
jgi:beta-lactamase class A